MLDEDNIDTRLAAEVATLSTRLVTEVAKLLLLEETILLLKRENASMKTQLAELTPLKTQHGTLAAQHEALVAQVATLEQQKAVAEAKNTQLEGEVEDLTASLFNEANQMVSDASRETYNFKLKNRKLIEELDEKDVIIESLQSQLKDLRALFIKMEDQHKTLSRANTPKMEHKFDGDAVAALAGAETDETAAVLSELLYGPRARAIRFDLPVYQLEFKSFLFQLIKPDFTFDLAALKTIKYFRKLWVEEIEPSVTYIPTLSGNFINRWSKGKSFWSLLVEGKAIIEPVSGVNETFKLTYKGAKTGTEVPVAIKDPCVFCGEHKDDLLEHARLYNLKLYGPALELSVNTTEFGGEQHEVVGSYPLCNFCLVKLRAICDFFAKLRLIHANIYKLRQNSLYDDIALVSNFQFKRSTDTLRKAQPETHAEDEPVVLKLYMMLLVIRAKIFWSRIGFWDTEEDVDSLSLDEINMDVFRDIVRDNVAFRTGHMKSVDEVSAEPVATTTQTLEQTEQAIGEAKAEERALGEFAADAEQTEEPEQKERSDDDDEFADTSDTFQKDLPIKRRKSKTKELKEKINKDLDDTMGMLRESLDETPQP